MRGVIVALGVALGLALAACRSAAPAAGPGERVVSLTPSATEALAALGAADLIVGVDTYSTYPAQVKGLPKVGSFLAPDVEAIARLRPTLVVADDIHDSAIAALGDVGVTRVTRLPMHTLPDVLTALRSLGDLLGRQDAATANVQEIERAIEAARAATAARGAGAAPRVLAIIDREPGGIGGLVAAGTGSWVDELLALVGADNALAGAGARYPKLALEDVVRAAPDVILDASYAADPAAPLSPWAGVDVPAVKAGRVVVAKESYVLAPSPRVAEALAAVARVLGK